MTIPRSAQVSLNETPYYHCIARCVRRAFLCGEDTYSGKNFDHRRQWLVDRLKHQAAIFGIDICAYAIMSNHYHVVVRVDKQRVLNWTEEEIMERWTRLFRGPLLVQRLQAGNPLSQVERQTVSDIVAVWRKRLFDISWFMRCLNETISRQANAEDDCTGRFWEGRFKSQALLNDAAVLSCMAYVDLNPIRAGTAKKLADSDFTSVQERIRAHSHTRDLNPSDEPGLRLLPFAEGHGDDHSRALINFSLRAYLDLVETTGRHLMEDRPGSIPGEGSSLLTQIALSPTQWVALSLEIPAMQLQAVGDPVEIRSFGRASGRRWLHGTSRMESIYSRV